MNLYDSPLETDVGRERLVGVGAGKLASALLPALHRAGIDIEQVFSRDTEKAEAMGRAINAQGVDSLQQLNSTATIYLLAVPDDALHEVATAVSLRIADHANPPVSARPPMLVHCSGSASSVTLSQGNIPYGVFYPVQSFSYGIAPDFTQIPICLTGSTPQAEDRLASLALALGGPVHRISDAQRAQLHLAAVLVNNFPNHLFALAAQWMEARDLPFSMLQPLLLETARKATIADPRGLQTGPALRGDVATLDRHLNALSDQPELAALYRLLTASIQRLARP